MPTKNIRHLEQHGPTAKSDLPSKVRVKDKGDSNRECWQTPESARDGGSGA